jgi:hypothetical protein
MKEESAFSMPEDTVLRLARVMLSDATPPPWVDSAADPESVADLQAEFIETIREMNDELGRPGPAMLEVLQVVFYRAASWGWDAAMNNGPTAQRIARYAASAARKAKADKSHSNVVAAFERCAAEGTEPDIDSIAKECGVSRATVYRALANRK